MLASATGNAAAVRELLEGGADVNQLGTRGSTALMFAAGSGHLEIVKILVLAQADVCAREEGGWSALQHASIDGHAEIVEFLGPLTASCAFANDDPTVRRYLSKVAKVM